MSSLPKRSVNMAFLKDGLLIDKVASLEELTKLVDRINLIKSLTEKELEILSKVNTSHYVKFNRAMPEREKEYDRLIDHKLLVEAFIAGSRVVALTQLGFSIHSAILFL